MSGKDELLDKAIVEAKEAEDWQLVEWLRAARGSESAARWYSGKLRDANRVKRKLLNENAKLRELLQDYHRYEHEDCYSCRYINECRADESGRCIAPMRLSERYRELGIEVDE